MAVSIILGLTLLYFLSNLLILSFFLDKVLEKAIPQHDAVEAFNGLLLYYFLLDLFMRFQLQELPTLRVKPYLALPISKNKIVRYLSLTSLWTGFTLSPFLLAGPFLLKVLVFEGYGSEFLAMIIAIAGFTLFNHFFSLWLKRKININAWFMFAFLVALAIIVLADIYLDAVSISSASRFIFNAIIKNEYLALLPVGAGIGMYYVNRSYLRSNLYLDELRKERAVERTAIDIPFLKNFGMAGQLAALEIKLILRNKRPKSSVIMSLFFMLYGLIFYRNTEFEGTIMVFAGLMMTGIFIINYGQFMFSWQSSHFDGILASKITPEDFFKSKFLLFTLFSTLNLILTTPYAYFGWKILLSHLMLYFWNIGVSSLIVLFFANWNYKYIDLSKGASFNWEGVGASQFIIGFPLFILPIAVYFLVKLAFNPLAAMLALGLIGVLFLLSRQFWLNKLVKNFKSKKYTIAAGFRER